jgi:hypothetical protein
MSVSPQRLLAQFGVQVHVPHSETMVPQPMTVGSVSHCGRSQTFWPGAP